MLKAVAKGKLAPRPAKPFGSWLLARRKRPGSVGDLTRGCYRSAVPKLAMPYEVLESVRLTDVHGDQAAVVDGAAGEDPIYPYADGEPKTRDKWRYGSAVGPLHARFGRFSE
jgi:hypothetical protein